MNINIITCILKSQLQISLCIINISLLLHVFQILLHIILKILWFIYIYIQKLLNIFIDIIICSIDLISLILVFHIYISFYYYIFYYGSYYVYILYIFIFIHLIHHYLDVYIHIYIYKLLNVYIYICLWLYIWWLIKFLRPGTAILREKNISRIFRELRVIHLSRNPYWATTPLVKVRSSPAKSHKIITDNFFIAL